MATGTNKGLQFKLGLSTLQAKKDVKDFVKWANKQGGKLNVITGTSGSGGGGRGGRVKPAVSSEQNHLKKLEKMRKDFLSKMIQIETRNGKTVEHLRKDTENRLTALIRSGHGRELEQTRRHLNELLTEYRTHSSRHIQNEKATGRDIRKAVERHNQRILEAVKNSDAALRRQEVLSGRESVELRQRYLIERQKILDNAQTMELGDVRRHLSILRAEYQRSTIVINQETQNLGRASGKMTNTLFNVNQAIEDFSFAGIRGAANNLSMMAATMGGPAGAIALLGLMGVSVYNLTESLGLWGQETEDQNERLKRQLELLRDLKDEERSGRDSFRRTPMSGMGAAIGDFEADIRELKQHIADERRDISKSGQLVRDIEDLRKLQEAAVMFSAVPSAMLPDGIKDREKFLRETKAKHAALMDKILKDRPSLSARELMQDVGINPVVDKGMELLPDFITPEVGKNVLLESAKEENKSSQVTLRKELAELERTKKFLKEARSFHKEFQGLDAVSKETLGIPELVSGMDPIFGKDLDRHTRTVEDLRRKLESKASGIAKSALESHGLGDTREAMNILESGAEELEKFREEQAQVLQQEAELLNFRGQSHTFATDMLEISKQQVALAERKVKAIEDEIAALKRAKQQSQFGFESQVFGAESGIIDKKAGVANNNISQMAEFSKRRQEFMLTKMLGKKNPNLSKAIEFGSMMIDRRVEMMRRNVANEQRRQQRGLLGRRVGVLTDRSEGQAKSGDFEAARGSLQEVQGLLLSASSSAESPQEAMMFLNRAKKIQKQILELYEAQMKSKEKEKVDARELLAGFKELENTAGAFKKLLETTNLNGLKNRLGEVKASMLDLLGTAQQLNGALGGDAPTLPTVPGIPQAAMTPNLPGAMASNSTTNNSNVTNNFSATVNTAAVNTGALMRDLQFAGKSAGMRMS